MWNRTKILTGILMAVLIGLFIRYAPSWLYQLLILGVGGICLYEFMAMALPKTLSSSPKLGWIAGVFFLGLLLFANRNPLFWLAGLSLATMGIFIYYVFYFEDIHLALPQVAITVLGIIYVDSLFIFASYLRELERGPFWVFLTAGCTFMSDAAAYFAGHLFGRHKLAPKVSPSKTWEGFAGGIVGSIFAAFVCRWLLWDGFQISSCLIFGALIGIVGPLGDLSESLIKRSVGVKDAGELIPGHGGLLDRLDALFFACPVAYFYATLAYHVRTT